MPTNYIVLALKALHLQPRIKGVEAIKPGSWNQEVTTAKANYTLDIALVVTLAWPTKLVLE